MTLEELISAVPIHERNGRRYFVALDDIPEPWRGQFRSALFGSQCPVINGYGDCAYAWDWQDWVMGRWRGLSPGPVGLTPTIGAITIPATSPSCYIGGMAALNLPSPNGTGDWHMEQTFFRLREKRARSFISGSGCPTDTNSLLGDAGVYDCTAILDDLGILHESAVAYAANHARATADLVLSAVLRSASPDFVVLDDWMPRDEDKQQVYDLLEKALRHLTSDQKAQVLEWQKKSKSA